MAPRLENWSSLEGKLIGYVFDDPRFSDGDLIRTTEIVWINEIEAQTKNTLYKLGKAYESLSSTEGQEINPPTICIRNVKDDDGLH